LNEERKRRAVEEEKANRKASKDAGKAAGAGAGAGVDDAGMCILVGGRGFRKDSVNNLT
jgi:hypothetical protein